MTLFNTKYDRKVDFIDVHRMETKITFGQYQFDSLHLCAMPSADGGGGASKDNFSDNAAYQIHHIAYLSPSKS
jgi:hypothetical protein